jgi:opacity protein-like surface antigen
MKKILLTTAALAAISTSAYAEMDNQFYLRGDVNASYFTKFKTNDVDAGGVKVKAATVMGIDLGAGYYVMDNVRAELLYTQPFSLKMKGSKSTGKAAQVAQGAAAGAAGTSLTNVSIKHKPTVRALLARVHGDVIDLGMGKIFLTGGLGWSMVKNSVTVTDTVSSVAAAANSPVVITSPVTQFTAKNKNNIAYTIGAGATFDVAEGVHLDVAYSYRDFGKSKSATNKSVTGVSYGGTSFRSHVGSAGIRFDI